MEKILLALLKVLAFIFSVGAFAIAVAWILRLSSPTATWPFAPQ